MVLVTGSDKLSKCGGDSSNCGGGVAIAYSLFKVIKGYYICYKLYKEEDLVLRSYRLLQIWGPLVGRT